MQPEAQAVNQPAFHQQQQAPPQQPPARPPPPQQAQQPYTVKMAIRIVFGRNTVVRQNKEAVSC